MPPQETSFTKLLDRREAQLARLLEEHPEIQTVKSSYGGSGDEGMVEAPEFLKADKTRVDLPEDHPAINCFQNMMEEFVGEEYGSFGDGTGSDGIITFDPRQRQVTIAHSYFEETACTEKPATLPLGQENRLTDEETAELKAICQERDIPLTGLKMGFNGCGDQGTFFWNLDRPNEGRRDIENCPVFEKILHVTDTTFSANHSGWENDGGSSGSAIFNPDTQTLNVEITSYEDSLSKCEPVILNNLPHLAHPQVVERAGLTPEHVKTTDRLYAQQPAQTAEPLIR